MLARCESAADRRALGTPGQWRAVALLVGFALVFGVALGWAIAGSGGAAPPAPAPVGMRLPTTKNAEWEAFIMHSCDDGQFQLTMRKDAEGEYIGGWVVDDEDGHPSKRIMGTERCAAHSDDAATSPLVSWIWAIAHGAAAEHSGCSSVELTLNDTDRF